MLGVRVRPSTLVVFIAGQSGYVRSFHPILQGVVERREWVAVAVTVVLCSIFFCFQNLITVNTPCGHGGLA